MLVRKERELITLREQNPFLCAVEFIELCQLLSRFEVTPVWIIVQFHHRVSGKWQVAWLHAIFCEEISMLKSPANVKYSASCNVVSGRFHSHIQLVKDLFPAQVDEVSKWPPGGILNWLEMIGTIKKRKDNYAWVK